MSFQIALGARERKSPYFNSTVKAGVSHFTIYNHMYLPVSFGDPEAEYHRLCNGVAIWDVAAERQVEIKGVDALALAKYLSPRKLDDFKIGQGKYVPICNHDGCLINDPILMKVDEDKYWLSIADLDLIHFVKAIAAERNFDVEVTEPDVSPLAVQGPLAEQLVADIFGDWIKDIRYFWFKETEIQGIPVIIMRSGWSKQGGFEIFLQDGSFGEKLWDIVYDAGEKYDIGPGAPNYIERVESGLLSFGADNEPDSDPFEMGLGKLVHLDREDDFVGKKALIERKKAGVKRKIVGLMLDGEPFLPNQHPLKVYNDNKVVGKVSTAAFSPKIGCNIGIALVDTEYTDLGTELKVADLVGDEVKYTGVVTQLPFGS